MKIAIASGKGGTGKTTLSTNLAAFLSEQEPVVLVDLDVEEPNSGLFITGDLKHEESKYKMIPRWDSTFCNLCGICQEVCNFNAVLKMGKNIMVFPELCHSCYACSELCPRNSLPMEKKAMGRLRHFEAGNLSFVESRLVIGEEQAVPLIKQTINYTDNVFPPEILRIYDSPPGTSCPVIESVKHADLVILITEPTPFGFHDLKLAVETMKELGKEFAVVINKHGIGNDDVDSYCSDNGIPVIGRIPNSRKIAERYSRGELLYRTLPDVKTAVAGIGGYIRNMRNGRQS